VPRLRVPRLRVPRLRVPRLRLPRLRLREVRLWKIYNKAKDRFRNLYKNICVGNEKRKDCGADLLSRKRKVCFTKYLCLVKYVKKILGKRSIDSQDFNKGKYSSTATMACMKVRRSIAFSGFFRPAYIDCQAMMFRKPGKLRTNKIEGLCLMLNCIREQDFIIKY
jgi:hypothetical protein